MRNIYKVPQQCLEAATLKGVLTQQCFQVPRDRPCLMRAQACVHFEAALYLLNIHNFLYSTLVHSYISPYLSLLYRSLKCSLSFYIAVAFFGPVHQASNCRLIPKPYRFSLIVRHKICWFKCIHSFDFTPTMRNTLTPLSH